MKTRTLTSAGLGAAAVAALTPVMLPATASASTTKTFKGTLERTYYSDVRVTISVGGRKIKALSVSANPPDQASYQLESYALGRLRKEALRTQSYKIHIVSGVTITSEGFIASLHSAMRHAHLR